MDGFDGFTARRLTLDGIELHVRTGGAISEPPLLLLHGFPQTHVMWRRVARALQDRFTLVIPDLRGYGDSSKPAGLPDHANYSKRAMALDMANLMTALGHQRFAVVGHDRGGRVAHRLALDHPERVEALCVVDIAPTLDMYESTSMAFATAYYHWFHLIQPSPLPERMIGADPRFYLRWKLRGWGSQGLEHIEPEALAEYERCFSAPETIHAACEDYRASAGIDLEHDRESRAAGRRVACPVHVLWGERGVVHRLFDPLCLWRACSSGAVSGAAMPAGHYIPEEMPGEFAAAVAAFLADRSP